MSDDRLSRPQHGVMGRAERIVRPRAGDAMLREFLGFQLGKDQFALPLPAILEILKLQPITEVPRAPRDVLGIVSVRGRVTTVIDLRRRLGMPETPSTRHARILIVKGADEPYGLLVDGVSQVHRFFEGEVEVSGSVGGGDLGDHVLGIGRPHMSVAGRAARGETRDVDESESDTQRVLGLGHDDIVVLLDPVALLRR